jgi:glycosyltransferase involved in cell wall biosynthesis
MAKVAVLPRTAGTTSLAGFPTKLGEYLSSGCLTIVTRTGDIGAFLVDGVDAILVEPDESSTFAARLREVLARYDDFVLIARNGRASALRLFDYRSGCRRLLSEMGMGLHEEDSVSRLRP